MNVITAIYNAPVIERIYDDLTVEVSIKYNGKVFTGKAKCHEKDKDFMSKKVGHSIALSRARIQTLEYEYKNAKQIADNKYRLYREVIAYGSKAPSLVDPTGAFFKNTSRAMKRADDFQKALAKEKDSLKNYIEGQSKALISIRRFRDKDNKS